MKEIQVLSCVNGKCRKFTESSDKLDMAHSIWDCKTDYTVDILQPRPMHIQLTIADVPFQVGRS